MQILRHIYCISCGEVKLSIAISLATCFEILTFSCLNPFIAISSNSFIFQDSISIKLNLPAKSALFLMGASALCGNEIIIALKSLLMASLR
ncbi:hypothetical protein [Clostridium estertheticum]|uniref:Uncharacterized protein n=1 Tax=Clostridium estertheticum TaxID=238834 RepID=A0A7Y3WTI7_9CLOT|nr:hypothetical protein [Clostridium estertheticum]NNU78222.1 hypothetical protein [Clostridium estertheticum]